MSAVRIAAIALRCRDPAGTAEFYRRALGCRAGNGGGPDGAALWLGAQRLLLRPALDGAPAAAPGNATAFQHFAVAVSSMEAATRHLGTVPGWTPISLAGPERLPAASGGVSAFKFRDPDGHPLELLQFPPDAVPPAWRGAGNGTSPFLGIDHSAISVGDTARAAAFYAGLGFGAGPTRVNRGPEQARLDGLPGAVVEVTPLRPAGGDPPQLELLRYRCPVAEPAPAADGAVAATCLVLECPGVRRERDLRDPDGHRSRAEPAGAGG